MIRGVAWLCWALISVSALSWSLYLGLEYDSGGRFWMLLALSVGVAGWLGGYDRARIVGTFGAVAAFLMIVLMGDDQKLPLIDYPHWEHYPLAIAAIWLLPAWIYKNECFYFEAWSCVVIAALFLAYYPIGAEFIKGWPVEGAFAALLAISIGGGIGYARKHYGIRNLAGSRSHSVLSRMGSSEASKTNSKSLAKANQG